MGKHSKKKQEDSDSESDSYEEEKDVKDKKIIKTKKSEALVPKNKNGKVDEYFKDKNKYHILIDNKNNKGSCYNCLLQKKDEKSNKFYIIQLLENNTNKKIVLFTRWGKIDAIGNQNTKIIDDKNQGHKLYWKIYEQKIKEGYKESLISNIDKGDEDEDEIDNDDKEEELKKIVEVIKRLSKMEIYEINLIEKSKPDITDSKFGGLPYWPKGKKYPENEEAEKLYLLAQINFEKEKFENPFPNKGILQFFICGEGDFCGANFFKDQTKQNNFRIIYHDTLDKSITYETVKKMNIPSNLDHEEFPIRGEYKITIEKGIDYISINDVNFNKIFNKAYKEVFNKELDENTSIDDIYDDNWIDIMEEELIRDSDSNKSRHKILGYPFFTQEDPRHDEKYKEFDTLLLQIDSDMDYIMWGDCGVCNFFIRNEDLIKKDFSKVLYNWDCS